MNPAIEGLLATLDQACTIALNKTRNIQLTDEQIDDIISEIKDTPPDQLPNLQHPVHKLSDIILGDHKQMIQRNTYDSLDTLRSLTFEEFQEYQNFSETRMRTFLAEFKPAINHVFQQQVMPRVLKYALTRLADLVGEQRDFTPPPWEQVWGGPDEHGHDCGHDH